MGAKKTTASFQQKVDQTIQTINRLQQKGYEFIGTTGMPQSFNLPEGKTRGQRKKDAYIGTDLGGPMVTNGNMMFIADTNPEAIKGGTDKKGFIRWGPKNDLPAQIYRAAGSLPYTAAALRYLVDLTVGLGPQLMYSYSVFDGKRIKEELCPYDMAGDLLRGQILALRQKIAEEEPEEGIPTNASYTVPVGKPFGESRGTMEYRTKPAPQEPEFQPTDPKTIGTLQDELNRLLDDYAVWERTMVEVRDFHTRNNLEELYLKCCTDDVHLDIYFPTIGLSQGGTKEWDKAKIKEVGFIPAVCCRFEEKDERLNINYVYYSEKWRSRDSKLTKTDDSVAYPVLPTHGRVQALRKKVEEGRRKSIKERQLWYCCPNVYPSGMRSYYPIPAWWSIFSSFVYQYALTLVGDKYIAQKNSTMWGKLIYINAFYLEKLYNQMGDDSDEKKQKRRDKIVNMINDFLRSRENNGKTCSLDSFIGPDGKTVMHSIELVDVPTPQKAAMSKEEMEQISSIIFFSLGVHPGLVGAVPGKTTSGGTFQRELSLLKQQQVSGRQRAFLNLLNDICTFNQWDRHACYVIKQQVLTTLDRNANGLEETISE